MTSPGGRRARRCRSCSGSRRRCSTTTGSGARWRRSRSTPRPARRARGAARSSASGRRRPPARRSDHVAGRRRLRGLGAGRQGLGRRTGASRARSGRCRPAAPTASSLYVRPRPGQRRRGDAGRRRRWSGCASSPGPAGLVVCDSACGQPKTLRPDRHAGPAVHRAAARQHRVPRAVPARGRPRRAAPAALRRPSAKRGCPPARRTRYRGALRDWEISRPRDRPPLALRVAYIHSSEEAPRGRRRPRARAGQGRGRARARPATASAAATTRPASHVDARVATDPRPPPSAGLIDVTTATRARQARPSPARATSTRSTPPPRTDGIYALATNLPGRLTADHDPRALQGPADRRAPPPRLQTDPQGPPDLPAQRRPHLRPDQHRRPRAADLRPHRSPDPRTRSATTNNSPACCPKAAPPNPPAATSSPPSKASASPTPTTASASTDSPTPNAASSNSSKSTRPGQSTQHLALTNCGKRG